jgi:hypothetical protein
MGRTGVDRLAESSTNPGSPRRSSPTWGFHLDDVNLAVGNLVSDVRAQEQAYQSASRH